MTAVAIHQPCYLPWMGFFAKMLASDVFILLDNVQYSKNSYQNRVQIKTSQGAQWLTQPVSTSGKFGQQLSEVRFAGLEWTRKHLNTLQVNYGRAPYFEDYFQQLTTLLADADTTLYVCNRDLILWLRGALKIHGSLLRASELSDAASSPTQRLIELVKTVRGDTYVSGAGGFNYQDVDEFQQAGVNVVRVHTEPSSYPQLWGPFTPGLSILDLLFNCGPESRAYLEKSCIRA